MKWKSLALAIALSTGVSVTASAHDINSDEALTELRVVYEECVRCCVALQMHGSVIRLENDTCGSLCKEFAVNALRTSVGIEGIMDDIRSIISFWD